MCLNILIIKHSIIYYIVIATYNISISMNSNIYYSNYYIISIICILFIVVIV